MKTVILYIFLSTLISFSSGNFMSDFLRRNGAPIMYPFIIPRGTNVTYFVENVFLEENVTKAVNVFERQTCLNFTKVDHEEKLSKDGNAFIFKYAKNCTALPGRDPNNKPSYIFLHEECMSSYNIQILLGFVFARYSDHSTYDKEDYMNFLWGNITHTYKKTFDVSNDINEPSIKGKYGIKLAPNTDSIDIKKRSNDKDYDSDTKLRISKIMEDLNSLNLFTLLEGKYYDSVENDSLGFTDFKLINAYYCHRICKTKLECKNSGYADPRDCSKCKCPTFYEGTYCEDLKKFNDNCTAPHTLNITNDTFIKLDDQGKKTCYTSIKAPEGKTVEIVLKQVSFETLNEDENIRCLSNQSLEVRYYKDKGPMGALFCGTLHDRSFNSHGNIVDVRFSGAYSADTYSMEVRVSNKTYEKTVCDKQGFIKI